MGNPGNDTVFAGSIPELYDTYLVPLIFEPYAGDLARRAAALAPSRVLEIAAGTGVVTRAMAQALPASADPCGEKGEFHSCVVAGPMLSRRIPVTVGEVVEREGFALLAGKRVGIVANPASVNSKLIKHRRCAEALHQGKAGVDVRPGARDLRGGLRRR